MKTEIYILKTISNLHVGSGEYNEGVIDKLVQRDVINKYPVVNSSSLKGALREFFETNADDKFVSHVFGASPKEERDEYKISGSFRFFDANLLSTPVRSDKAAYLRATSVDILKELFMKLNVFGVQEQYTEFISVLSFLININPIEGTPIVLNEKLDNAIIEDFELKAVLYDNLPINNRIWPTGELKKSLSKYFGNRLVILHNNDFYNLCGPNMLPVISRNYLENGESKNLWYEEVVPRLSQFYFFVIEDEIYADSFKQTLTDSLVQIGGNSSIGYGFSMIESINNINLELYEY